MGVVWLLSVTCYPLFIVCANLSTISPKAFSFLNCFSVFLIGPNPPKKMSVPSRYKSYKRYNSVVWDTPSIHFIQSKLNTSCTLCLCFISSRGSVLCDIIFPLSCIIPNSNFWQLKSLWVELFLKSIVSLFFKLYIHYKQYGFQSPLHYISTHIL